MRRRGSEKEKMCKGHHKSNVSNMKSLVLKEMFSLTFKALFPLLVVVMPQEPCSSEQTYKDTPEQNIRDIVKDC